MGSSIQPAPQYGPSPLMQRWAERHGLDAAERLAQAEQLADAVSAAITPENTTDTYTKSWRVWERFCTSKDQPTCADCPLAQVCPVSSLVAPLRNEPQRGRDWPRPFAIRPAG